jgi:NAD(P)-dependent dehydrogenase (short-subunit alcohol dehydrogenase family)
MDINLRGVFLTCQRAAQVMIAAGHGGTMVTLASMASKRPTAGVYSISKAAVWMMTRCLANELGRHDIRLNAIGPGYIQTDLFESIVVDSAGADAAAQEAFREARRSQVALGRFGTPEDVAVTALFLCSDEAGYFTGSILHPDGGYTSTFGGG